MAQLAYTGVLRGPEADFELAADHKATERLILDSGLPYTFLRNGWYTENYTENLAPVLEHGAVVAAAGEGHVASAARADYAAAAAAVLTGEGHLGKAYELSGDTAWSFAEYAAELSRQTGRTIVYSNVPGETLLGILTGAGVPEPMAAILLGVDKAIERGLLAGTPGDLSRLSGRPRPRWPSRSRRLSSPEAVPLAALLRLAGSWEFGPSPEGVLQGDVRGGERASSAGDLYVTRARRSNVVTTRRPRPQESR